MMFADGARLPIGMESLRAGGPLVPREGGKGGLISLRARNSGPRERARDAVEIVMEGRLIDMPTRGEREKERRRGRDSGEGCEGYTDRRILQGQTSKGTCN